MPSYWHVVRGAERLAKGGSGRFHIGVPFSLTILEMRMSRPGELNCLRCRTPLQFMGTKKFHEGTRWSVFGDLAELFENREHFDVFMCPNCGKVELFVDGVGEELRSE